VARSDEGVVDSYNFIFSLYLLFTFFSPGEESYKEDLPAEPRRYFEGRIR